MEDFGDTRILDVAADLFRIKGYASVSLSQIAEKVDINKSTLYHHFKSKEEIFLNVHLRALEHHKQGLSKIIEDSNIELRSILISVIDWLLTQPPLEMIAMMKYDMNIVSDETKNDIMDALYHALYVPIGRIFEEAKERGEIRDVNPHSLVGTIISIIEGANVMSSLDPSEKRASLLEIVDIIITGLRHDPKE